MLMLSCHRRCWVGWKLMYMKTLQTWAHLLNLLIQLVSWRTLLLLQMTLFQIRIFFSHYHDHLPFQAQWEYEFEYEFDTDRLRWHIFDGLHAWICVFTIKAKRSVWGFTASNRYLITQPNFHFSAKVRGVLIKTFPSFRDIIALLTITNITV